MSATEINDLHLLNVNGRIEHIDEWNSEIYKAMKKPYLKEDSSRDFVESIRYSEFNDLTRKHTSSADTRICADR